ncbi:MAG: hypothetical protein ACLUFF_00975 [Acutalibacteraceae bacterium]
MMTIWKSRPGCAATVKHKSSKDTGIACVFFCALFAGHSLIAGGGGKQNLPRLPRGPYLRQPRNHQPTAPACIGLWKTPPMYANFANKQRSSLVMWERKKYNKVDLCNIRQYAKSFDLASEENYFRIKRNKAKNGLIKRKWICLFYLKQIKMASIDRCLTCLTQLEKWTMAHGQAHTPQM